MQCENAVKWVYRLPASHVWESGLAIDRDLAFKDKSGRVRLILERGGRLTVTRGYAWNGCSPKLCLFDILLGTPEGVVDARTGKPKTYYASLVHDALYQFLSDGLPITRRDADHCFLALLAETGFRPRRLYFAAVRMFGGLVRHVEKSQRATDGTAVPL